MPFGICNAPATFERLIESVLRVLTYEACLVYLDDVTVGRTFQEQVNNSRRVFQRLREAHLKWNSETCQLFRKVRYLGHISPPAVTTDPENLEAVISWPRPNDKHRLSFPGLCTY